MKNFNCLFTAIMLIATSFFTYAQDVEYSGLIHSPIDNTSLVVEDNNLIVTNPGSEDFGFSIDLVNYDGINLYFEPVKVEEGGEFKISVNDQFSEAIGAMKVQNIGGNQKQFLVQLEGGEPYTVKAFLDGNEVYQEEAFTNNSQSLIPWIPIVLFVLDNIDGHYKSTTTTTTDPEGNVTTTETTEWEVSWGNSSIVSGDEDQGGENDYPPALLEFPSGALVEADLIVVEVVRTVEVPYELGQMEVIGTNMPSLVITSEYPFETGEGNGFTMEPSPSTVGILFETDGLNLSEFPNPAKGQLTVEYYLPTQNKVDITFHDITGKQIFRTMSSDLQEKGYQIQTIDISSFQNGIYFYTFRSGEYSETRKIIIER